MALYTTEFTALTKVENRVSLRLSEVLDSSVPNSCKASCNQRYDQKGKGGKGSKHCLSEKVHIAFLRLSRGSERLYGSLEQLISNLRIVVCDLMQTPLLSRVLEKLRARPFNHFSTVF